MPTTQFSKLEVAAAESKTRGVHRQQLANAEIYVGDLLLREGHSSATAKNKRIPAVTAAAAGVIALCGVITASVLHVQDANGKTLNAGAPGVPLTVVSGDSSSPTSSALITSLASAPSTTQQAAISEPGKSSTTQHPTTTTTPSSSATAAPRQTQSSRPGSAAQLVQPTTTSSAASSSSATTTTTTHQPTTSTTTPPDNGDLLGGLLGPILNLL